MHEYNVLGAISGARKLRTHSDLFRWLQSDVAAFLPHDILIAAWGDFVSGKPCLDVVSGLPGVRTTHLCCEALQPLTLDMFAVWAAGGFVPLVRELSAGEAAYSTDHEIVSGLAGMRSAVAHGIKDERGGQDCFYVALSARSEINAREVELIGLLMPCIDAAFRQVALLPMQREGSAALEVSLPGVLPGAAGLVDGGGSSLSGRELEIMHWVRSGKTNPEIGQILGISPLTVRNHLQRVFRKLEVMNRAQAVYQLERGAGRLAERLDEGEGDVSVLPLASQTG